MILVLDNGSCHISNATRQALAERGDWLEVLPLARYSPHLNPKEHEWRRLKRDHRGHLAGSLREFVDTAWWATLFPCLMLFLTVLAFNLIGDRVARRFDIREAVI